MVGGGEPLYLDFFFKFCSLYPEITMSYMHGVVVSTLAAILQLLFSVGFCSLTDCSIFTK